MHQLHYPRFNAFKQNHWMEKKVYVQLSWTEGEGWTPANVQSKHSMMKP